MPRFRRARGVCAWLTAAIVLAAAPSATAQLRVAAEQGQFRWVLGGAWRQADGLPQDRIISITQTRDGYLWVGTRGGAARFDGNRFAILDREPGLGFPEGEVFASTEAPDGSLWIGVYGAGLVHLHNGRVSILSTVDGLVDNNILSIAVGRDGAIWVGTDRGLSRLYENRFTNYRAQDGLGHDFVRALYVDPVDGSILVGTGAGLVRFANGRFTAIPLLASKGPVAVEGLTHDRAGRLWVASPEGVFRLSGSTIARFGPDQGLSSSRTHAVFEDSKGRIWIATNVGIDRADTIDASTRPFVPVLAGTDCVAIMEDREGSIWVGSSGLGLFRLHISLFTVFDQSAGLGPGGATTVFQTSDGTIWTGVGSLLGAIRNGRVQNYGKESGLEMHSVSALAEDHQHHLWVGAERGLFRSVEPVARQADGPRLHFVLATTNPALLTHIRVLCPDGNESMLAGTNSDGVFRVTTDGQAHQLPAVAGAEVRAIVREASGRIWVGTRNKGLIRLDGNIATTYTPREGLAHLNVQSLFLDRDGTLWIATRHGLSWIADGHLRSITAAQGLHQNHIYGLTEDGHGQLWMASGSGLFSVSEDEVRALGNGSVPQVSSVDYGLEHGLTSTLFAISHHPVIMTSSDGHIWAAGSGGVVELDPTQSRMETLPPPVHLEGLKVNGVSYLPDYPAEAKAGAGRLDFSFTALSFVAPRRMEFRYRLEGFDQSWVAAGTSREARYTNIPPGRYRFMVTARNRDSEWNPVGATVSLVLVPLFYQASWFRLLAVLSVIGLFVGAGSVWHRRRVAMLQAREAELHVRVDEAVARIKVLSGLLPVCSWCHRIRDDQGYWTQMESYVREHSQAEFSHSLCPDCLKEHFPDDAASVLAEGRTRGE
jgi:ligand-binding sensor domain-containing protein